MARTPNPICFGDHPPKQGERKFDELPPDEAVRRAWTDAESMPTVLAIRQDAVRELMPTLARALDRLSDSQGPEPADPHGQAAAPGAGVNRRNRGGPAVRD